MRKKATVPRLRPRRGRPALPAAPLAPHLRLPSPGTTLALHMGAELRREGGREGWGSRGVLTRPDAPPSAGPHYSLSPVPGDLLEGRKGQGSCPSWVPVLSAAQAHPEGLHTAFQPGPVSSRGFCFPGVFPGNYFPSKLTEPPTGWPQPQKDLWAGRGTSPPFLTLPSTHSSERRSVHF